MAGELLAELGCGNEVLTAWFACRYWPDVHNSALERQRPRWHAWFSNPVLTGMGSNAIDWLGMFACKQSPGVSFVHQHDKEIPRLAALARHDSLM